MPATYKPIATQTLGSNAASVTFSSIPATYTDLVLITQSASTGVSENIGLQFNADTGNNYSYTEVSGNGSTAASTRQANFSRANLTDRIGTSVDLGECDIISNIMNYANTTTFKTLISRANTVDTIFPGANATVGLWRNTVAITSITVMQSGSVNFKTGSTFTLYGIKAA